MLLGGTQGANSIFFYSWDSDITHHKDNCLFIVYTQYIHKWDYLLYLYPYICVSVHVYVYSCQHVSSWIKTAMKHEEACKRWQKSKDSFLPITLIATCCERLSNMVTFMSVRVHESRRGCPKICHCRGPFGSDNIRKTDHPRFHKVCWTQLSTYSMSTHSVGKLAPRDTLRPPIDIINDIIPSLIMNDLARKSHFLNNVTHDSDFNIKYFFYLFLFLNSFLLFLNFLFK